MASQGAFRDIRPNGLPIAKVQRLRKADSPALGPEMPGIWGCPGRDEWRPQRAVVRGGPGRTRRTLVEILAFRWVWLNPAPISFNCLSAVACRCVPKRALAAVRPAYQGCPA